MRETKGIISVLTGLPLLGDVVLAAAEGTECGEKAAGPVYMGLYRAGARRIARESRHCQPQTGVSSSSTAPGGGSM